MCKILRKTELLKALIILANIVKFLNSRCFKLSISLPSLPFLQHHQLNQWIPGVLVVPVVEKEYSYPCS